VLKLLSRDFPGIGIGRLNWLLARLFGAREAAGK
jgi:hypothetical protein